MGLFPRIRNADIVEQPLMPRHDQIADGKFYEIFGQGRFNKKCKYGFGLVLIDNDGQQTAPYLVGHKPANIEAAALSVLGPFGPLPRRFRAAQPFSESDICRDGILKEALLITKLDEQPTIRESEAADAKSKLMAKLIQDGGLRVGEEFTPITYSLPAEVHPPFGPYDLVG